MSSGFLWPKTLILLPLSLAQVAHAQLQEWGDYPKWPTGVAVANQTGDFAVFSELSRPAIREWQRQQTNLTQKLLSRLTETQDFSLKLTAPDLPKPGVPQALAWQQQHFYSEIAKDGRCRVILRKLPVGNEQTLYVCEANQQLLGFRLAADASLLAVLLQEKNANKADGPTQLIRLVQIEGQKLFAEQIPTASQHAQEIIALPKAAGVLYRPPLSPALRNKPALLHWHASGQAMSEDKPAFPQKASVTTTKLEIKNARDSHKLSLSWLQQNQIYPQVWLLDLEKFDASKPRFNWQRRFGSSEQVRDLSFDDKALYWISTRGDLRGKLWRQAWQAGSAAQAIALKAKPDLWQIHASDGNLWLHQIEQAQSKLLKYDLSKQQVSSLSLPMQGRLSQLAGELPGFLLESAQQAPLTYQLSAQDDLKNWDIARPYLAPVAITEQSHVLAAYPDWQLRVLHKRGIEADGKRPVILMAEKLNQFEQLPRFNAQWYAWLERDGVLAWLQNTSTSPEKPLKLSAKKATTPKSDALACQALLAAAEYLQKAGFAQARSLFLSERAPAPACWWQVVQQAPQQFAAIASNQLPLIDTSALQKIVARNYPAILLSVDGKTELKPQLNFMPQLAQLQQANQMLARPILFRSEILGNWQAATDTALADDWGFFWWRYRQELANRGKP